MRLFINKAFSFIKGALIQPEADLAQFPGDISEKPILTVGGFSSFYPVYDVSVLCSILCLSRYFWPLGGSENHP